MKEFIFNINLIERVLKDYEVRRENVDGSLDFEAINEAIHLVEEEYLVTRYWMKEEVAYNEVVYQLYSLRLISEDQIFQSKNNLVIDRINIEKYIGIYP